MQLKQIATMHTPFSTKFGVPRQSGLVAVPGEIVFLPAYRDANALRGMEDYSHLWVIWGFSAVPETDHFAPTVRPPRLGGNTRMGVFATRSPYRPNPIGLSVVRLCGIKETEENGMVLEVSGVDMTDGTPIYDIKPYLPYADSHADATAGFGGERFGAKLSVEWMCAYPGPTEEQAVLTALLAEDPRPSYQEDPAREYGFFYADKEVHFRVEDHVLYVVRVEGEQR